MSPENEIVGTRRRKLCKIAPCYNRVLSRKSMLYFERIASVIFPYRQSLFRTLTRFVAVATNRPLSAFAIPSFGNELPLSLRSLRSLRLPLAATFAKLLPMLSRRCQFCSEAPVTSTSDGSLALLAKIYEAASLPHIFSLFWLASSPVL